MQGNLVNDYQQSYAKTMDVLKKNEDVLAVFVFGSIITGDLWEKSDIDMFVVVKDWDESMSNIYSDFPGTPVHFKVFSKKSFLNTEDLEVEGSLMHRLFQSSRMVFSKDKEVETKYNEGRYYNDIARKKWTLSYLGNLIKAIDSSNKSYKNNNYTSAYASVISAMNHYAKVYINSTGYMVSKDNINIASNLDSEFEREFNILISEGTVKSRVERAVSYLENKIDDTISSTSEIIFSYLKSKEGGISSREMKKDPHFKDYNIEMETILDTLKRKKLIKSFSKRVETTNGELLIMENIYSI